jgi:enoyl-CoA hydratase
VAIDVEQRGPVAIVTMNRPGALNAFNVDQLKKMKSTFNDIAEDETIRSVVITGAGDRAFAAGADIKKMAQLSASEGLSFGRLGHAMTRAIEENPQPVIAAVNGFALGGGCELAIACDIRLAAESAVFGQPEVGLGIPPGWGATQRLPRLIGPGYASEMILTGRRIPAEEALRIGLVNAVYPAESLMSEAIELAEQIAAQSPRAVREAKRLMRLAFNETESSGLDTELWTFGTAFGTEEQREGMAAFIERRRPAFSAEGSQGEGE